MRGHLVVPSAVLAADARPGAGAWWWPPPPPQILGLINPRKKDATFEAVTTCIASIKYMGIPEVQKVCNMCAGG